MGVAICSRQSGCGRESRQKNLLLGRPDCGIGVFCQYPVKTQLRNFLLSLPERGLRSTTALAGGLLREVGDVAIPKTIRRSRLYRNIVEATLQFLIRAERIYLRFSWSEEQRATGLSGLEF
jgi:hypothetical protein